MVHVIHTQIYADSRNLWNQHQRVMQGWLCSILDSDIPTLGEEGRSERPASRSASDIPTAVECCISESLPHLEGVTTTT